MIYLRALIFSLFAVLTALPQHGPTTCSPVDLIQLGHVLPVLWEVVHEHK